MTWVLSKMLLLVGATPKPSKVSCGQATGTQHETLLLTRPVTGTLKTQSTFTPHTSQERCTT